MDLDGGFVVPVVGGSSVVHGYENRPENLYTRDRLSKTCFSRIIINT